MELFTLFATLAIKNKDANAAIDETTGKAGSAENKLASGIKTAAKWGAAIVTGAAAAATGVVKFAEKAASTADNVDKMSQKIGISRQAYQELDFICSQSGASVDNLKAGMKTLTNQMQSASEGSDKAVAAFDALGLSWVDSTGKLKDQETMMWEAMTALQNCENQTQKSALAVDLFGKAGTDLMPLLNGASGSIEEMKKQAHDLGLVLDDDAIDSGVKLTDTIDQVKRSFSSIVAKLGVEVMPIVQKVADKIVEKMPEIHQKFEDLKAKFDELKPKIKEVFDKLSDVGTWISEHQGLFVALGVVIGIITTAVTAYNVVQGITTAIQAAKTAANLAETASLWSLVAAQTAALAPYLLVVAAIAAVIAIIVLCVKHWDEIKAKVLEVAEKIKAKVTEMKDKVSAKFEELKAKIQGVIDNVKAKFQMVVDFFKNNWKELLLLIVNPFAGAFALLYKHNDDFRAKVDELKNKVVGIFTTMKDKITGVFENIKTSATEKFNSIKDKITSPIETAKEKIKGIVDKIKGFFSGLKLSFPDIKLPHFGISPSGWKVSDLLEGSIPKLSIEWYAKAMDNGMILEKPTIFGVNSKGQPMGAGEAGSETIVGTNSLMTMIKAAVSESNANANATLEKILAAIINIDRTMYEKVVAALQTMGIEFDERELARLVKKYA